MVKDDLNLQLNVSVTVRGYCRSNQARGLTPGCCMARSVGCIVNGRRCAVLCNVISSLFHGLHITQVEELCAVLFVRSCGYIR